MNKKILSIFPFYLICCLYCSALESHQKYDASKEMPHSQTQYDDLHKHPKHGPSKKSRILPGSDTFPNYITPETAKLILKNHPDLALSLKLINSSKKKSLVQSQRILLVGQPGVGKTTIAAALAFASQHKYTFIRSTHLAGNRYQNSGIEAIDEKLGAVLKEVTESQNPCIVVLDELGALTKTSQDSSSQAHATTAHLWTVLDDLHATNKVMIIATANSKEDLPGPLLSRFGSNIITINPPNQAFRKDLIKSILADQHTLSSEEINQIALKMEGFTIRTLEQTIRNAAKIAFMRDEQGAITYQDLTKAIADYNAQQPNIVFRAVGSCYRTIKDNAVIIGTVIDLLFKTTVVICNIITIANSLSNDNPIDLNPDPDENTTKES